MIIKDIQLYTILNSIGKPAIETQITSIEGTYALASSPSALLSGKRESQITKKIDEKTINSLINHLTYRELSQQQLDKILKQYLYTLGSDVCLSISLAFARLCAINNHCSLVEYIADEMSYTTKYKSPKPMVTLFSGGVHNQNEKTIQNIMIYAEADSFYESSKITSSVYSFIETYTSTHNMLLGYGQSSGMITKNLTTQQKFELISNAIQKNEYNAKLSIAVDIAAEHLWDNNQNIYCLENTYLTGEELFLLLQNYVDNFPVLFIEDPFDSDNEKLWSEFLKNNSNICIAGDDLFATQCKFLNNKLANGVIIKMNQAGTLSDTLQTVIKAKSLGMILCVSHRSVETEDTFMCDLAVAIDSDFVKIGGPRRGDRITKYNRIFRLERDRNK